MKRLILGVFGVLVALVVFGGCTAALLAPSDGDPLPQVAAGADEKATEAATEEEAAASTCDVVREALLTGTKVEIRDAMKALVADKTADADARESARDYLIRTDPDLKESAASLVQLGCS
jgi:hypothetical protein